jgi:CheY-like chemotaxis protein
VGIIRCLYLEDIPRDYLHYSTNVLPRILNGPHQAVFECAPSLTTAIDRIAGDPGSIDIFFSDWFMPKVHKVQLTAANAIREAAKHRHIAIIGISKTDKASDVRAFREAGGDDLFHKGEIQQDPLARTRERFQGILEMHNQSLYDPTLAWSPESSPQFAAQLAQTIGVAHLPHLLRKLDPKCTFFSPGAVTQGRSGALVLRVDAGNKDKTLRKLLVKISSDQEKLQRELDNAPETGEPSAKIYTPYLKDLGVQRLGDWYAIASAFEQDAVTLYDWLTAPDSGPSPGEVEETLRQFFALGLGEAYRDGEVAKGRSALHKLGMKQTRRDQILYALESLYALVPRLEAVYPGLGPSASGIEGLKKFLRRDTVHGRTAERLPDTYVCCCHGDLHSRNILKTPLGPTLIDTGRRGVAHWAVDAARLCADLWITAWEKDEGHFWDHLLGWHQTVVDWLPMDADGPIGPSPTGVVLGRLPGMVREVFGEEYFRLWEFHLALLWEFLAHTSYEDIPMPKRFLSVLLADEIVRRLEEEMPADQAA